MPKEKDYSCRWCIQLKTITTCNAFPGGIPLEILDGTTKHDKPMLGQKNNVIYTPDKSKNKITAKTRSSIFTG